VSTLLIHVHGFDLPTYLKHLFFDGIADAGGYYASRFCTHRWHRVAIAISFALVSTLALVTLVG
jgi:hypothetical protein